MRVKFLSISFLFLTALKGQDTSFTVKQALDMAIKQNLDIQIAQSDLEIAAINNSWGMQEHFPSSPEILVTQKPGPTSIRS